MIDLQLPALTDDDVAGNLFQRTIASIMRIFGDDAVSLVLFYNDAEFAFTGSLDAREPVARLRKLRREMASILMKVRL